MKSTIRYFAYIKKPVARIIFSGEIFIVLTFIILASGCDSPSRPTGPGELLSIPDSKTLASSHDATFHAIIVVDTSAGGDVADALRADLDHMSQLVETIAAYTGLTLRKYIFSGGQATVSRVRRTVGSLDVSPNDVLLFYFSGHGGRVASTNSQWPDMYLKDSKMNLADIFSGLRSKRGRLVFALGDACNSYLDNPSQTGTRQFAASRAASVEGLRKLFLEERAAIIASSSVPGEVSYAPADGSVFTTKFIQVFSRKVSDDSPSWPAIMSAATQGIPIAGTFQQPQYELY